MTSAQDPRAQQEAAQQLLEALAGIVSAHVVTDTQGAVVEIHILAPCDLHPKQVVRNVESALSAGLGVEIDRRIVSVAQIRSETANGSAPAAGSETAAGIPDDGGSAEGVDVAAPADAAGPAAALHHAERPGSDRLEYVRYEARRSGKRCTCSVVLRSGEEERTGSGEGADTTAGRAEAAARAVFDAIGRARPDLEIRLEGATISRTRGQSFALISAHRVLDRTTVPLAGAAVLHRSPEEAAILAALQASNRCDG